VTKAYYWPSAQQFAEADVIVFHLRPHNCSSNTGTAASCSPLSGTGGVVRLVDSAKIAQLDEYLGRGKGIVTVHPGNYPHQSFQDQWANRTGLVWRVGGTTATNTTYREGHVTLDFRKSQNPGHPILAGLPDTLKFDDEVYYPLFGHPDSVTVLATSTETFQGVSSAHPALWTYSRPGSTGRSYGFIMGHLHESFSDPVFRTLLLRGMAWVAKEPTFSRFRRAVLDSALYVNDVVGVRAGPPAAKPVIRANEGAGSFEWKGKPHRGDGRVLVPGPLDPQ
jgi:type 1 glutamine amidotransferase